jgi:hypothetical protein
VEAFGQTAGFDHRQGLAYEALRTQCTTRGQIENARLLPVAGRDQWHRSAPCSSWLVLDSSWTAACI